MCIGALANRRLRPRADSVSMLSGTRAGSGGRDPTMLQAGTGHRLASHDRPTKPRPSLAGTLGVAAAADRHGHRGRHDRSTSALARGRTGPTRLRDARDITPRRPAQRSPPTNPHVQSQSPVAVFETSENQTTRSRDNCREGRLLSIAMPSRRGLERSPIDYLADGQEWPYGRLIEDAPKVAKFVQLLIQQLHEACGGEKQPTVYAIAKKANVNPQTITNLLNGKTWGDVPIIYKLEATLERELWTFEHVPASWARRKDGKPLR